jgi:SagB-type dehydrogenase family enzyme
MLAAACAVYLIMASEILITSAVAGVIELPQPRQESGISVESALRQRRSVREFSGQALDLAETAQLLWAAQGITGPEGKRAAPSAGALYPLEIFLVAGKVEGLPAGVYWYRPQGHNLVRVAEGDRRTPLAAAALEQEWVKDAPAVIVISAVYERTARKYGRRAERYVPMEAGHAAQNIQLQAVALNLDSVVVGAFEDVEVERVLGLALSEQPLCLLPVGKARPQLRR